MPRLLVLLSLAACGGHYHGELVGRGVASIAPVETAPAPVAGPSLPPGSYELALHFAVPRAQVVAWSAACAEVTERGRVGETAEAYRVRRLAELAHDRDRDRAVAGSIAGALIGGAVGRATHDDRTADAAGSIAGDAAARAVPEVSELPPGDVGARVLTDHVRLVTARPGACAVTAVAGDGVTGSFEIARIRDAAALGMAAQRARTSISAQLVAAGADEDARLHHRAIAAQLALTTRSAVYAWLVACGGNPGRRDALLTSAVLVRGRLRGYLLASGAAARVERPPPSPPEPVEPAPETVAAPVLVSSPPPQPLLAPVQIEVRPRPHAPPHKAPPKRHP